MARLRLRRVFVNYACKGSTSESRAIAILHVLPLPYATREIDLTDLTFTMMMISIA